MVSISINFRSVSLLSLDFETEAFDSDLPLKNWHRSHSLNF